MEFKIEFSENVMKVWYNLFMSRIQHTLKRGVTKFLYDKAKNDCSTRQKFIDEKTLLKSILQIINKINKLHWKRIRENREKLNI